MQTTRRTFLITLGFVPNRLFRESASRVAKTLSGKHQIRKLFIAKPYPINLEENRKLNICTAQKYGYEVFIRTEDLGAAGDFNKTLGQIGLTQDDLVFICDHDAHPIEPGWDDAMIRVMDADPLVDWVSLWNDASPIEFGERGGIPAEIGGIRTIQAITPMMSVTTLMRGSFLLHTGGLLQPAKYYGGVEIGMWGSLVSRGTKKVFLCDYTEDQRLKVHEDLSYRAWKTEHATGRYAGSFSEFLEIQK